MLIHKSTLLRIAKKVRLSQRVTPEEVQILLSFEKKNTDHPVIAYLKKFAVPLSLCLGFVLAVYAEHFANLITRLPSWTNFSPEVLAGMNYLWSILGNPVPQSNLVYHLPNLILYSFGILGVKSLIDKLERRSWLDKVLDSQKMLQALLDAGEVPWLLKAGHSLLFVGGGDFIGMQFSMNHEAGESINISQAQPSYSKVWNCYDVNSVFEDLKKVIELSHGETAGEYLFFPVRDDSIFLPDQKAFDLSPHRLDILCQNIRLIEKEKRWKPKPILIVGDKFHSSFVQSEDQRKVIPHSQDTISLATIAHKDKLIRLFDPTDIVLKRILVIAHGRKIIFRATKEGIKEYKKRFYKRLTLLGYKPTAKTALTIGYDLSEDQTEQQTLAQKVRDYYPVVISKNIRDALVKKGYKSHQFLYVPDLVLETISKDAAKQ